MTTSFDSPAPVPASASFAPSRRRRRTQRERSRETQSVLLDATIECLAERGYAKTTAREVADRAGLSRGAQIHHFGTKAQLVTAAIERLFSRRFEEFRIAFEEQGQPDHSAGVAIDLLWSILSGPSGYAFMELIWAARTDADLRESVIALNERLDERIDRMFRELFESTPEAEPFFEIGWTAIFALLEGLAFERIVREDDDRVDRVLAALKQLAPLALSPKR